MLTLEDLLSLLAGQVDRPIEVGQLPDDVITRLGWKLPHVYLSADSLQHIYTKPDISHFDVLLLPLAISNGLLIHETARPEYVLSSYKRADGHQRYITVMKMAQDGCEIWIKSFHRARVRQTRSLLKRGSILKTHD